MRDIAAQLGFFERWMDPVAETMLEQHPDIEVTRLRYDDSREVNRRLLEEMHGYQVSTRGDLRAPWFADAELISRLPRLLAIQSSGAGFDVIDVAACTRAGIAVCNQAGSNFEAVAEHTLGFMLSLSKGIASADRRLRTSAGVDRYANVGRDIYGKTVGLVGLGHVGRRVAQLCGGLFHMTVLATDPYLTTDAMAGRGAEKVCLNDLLERSDFVSVHCPRNADTLGLIDASALSRMKASAFLISTARGGIVREDHLATALGAGTIAGAALDVFSVEPPATRHPLLKFDNFIATPHIAGVTNEALHEMAASAARQWLDLFAGRSPSCLLNPEVWPSYAKRFAATFGFSPD